MSGILWDSARGSRPGPVSAWRFFKYEVGRLGQTIDCSTEGAPFIDRVLVVGHAGIFLYGIVRFQFNERRHHGVLELSFTYPPRPFEYGLFVIVHGDQFVRSETIKRPCRVSRGPIVFPLIQLEIHGFFFFFWPCPGGLFR